MDVAPETSRDCLRAGTRVSRFDDSPITLRTILPRTKYSYSSSKASMRVFCTKAPHISRSFARGLLRREMPLVFPVLLPMAVFALATIDGTFGAEALLLAGRELRALATWWATGKGSGSGSGQGSGNSSSVGVRARRALMPWIGVCGLAGLGAVSAAADGALLAWALPAWLLADLVSGVVHCFGDTVGMPSFREHHGDPIIMTHHSFLFRNTEILALGAALHPVLVALAPAAKPLFDVTVMLAMFSNETHRWAHLRRVGKPVPAAVRRLQDWGLILTPARHARHHNGTFNTHFCIFAGVLDPILGPAFTAIHDHYNPPLASSSPQ
jgi:hypothetical protein